MEAAPMQRSEDRYGGHMTKLARRRWWLGLLAVGALQVASAAHATNSKAELEAVRRDLLVWWPGEYDTWPQVELERRYGAPPDGEHDRQYRVFRRVDVPHIGAHVIYGQVHVGGRDGPIIPGQQVLYKIELDAGRGAVVVQGRRIKDGPNHQLKDHTPEKLRSIAIDPDFGGNCDFVWRRHGSQLVGKLADLGSNNDTCTMISKLSGQKMTWDAEWVLTPTELWVFDNGYLHDQNDPNKKPRMFAGRADLTHRRMYKGQPYVCREGATQHEVYDTGGEWRSKFAGQPVTYRLARRFDAGADGVGLVERLTLAAWPGEGADPAANSVAIAVLPRREGTLELRGAGARVACKPVRSSQ
jgi:hypothetical protein